MGMTDTNKTDAGRQYHKTDEVCPIFMGMTDFEKQLTKQAKPVVFQFVIPAFLIFVLP
jgi:hypothetical protein